MPIYEYECTECGHRVELIQKITDSPLRRCVECKGKVERLISSPAIQFKGTGWYVTDYGRKGQPPSDASDESSKSSPSKDTTSKKSRSESGPAETASSTSKA